ncbi:MAG: lipocalin-like domain-containing protein [Dysgonamonadaceae bacterium]|nr:lipocalin-like domain-containing protein [Dysgonamonadaceae bacterium]
MIIILFCFSSCLDFNLPNVNGMWQLKTIQDENENIQTVDTIFYSFQRQAIFSYTILQEKENEAETSILIYGFIDFPDNDQLHIQLDEKQKNLAHLLIWEGKSDVTYNIVKLDSKKMVLFNDGKTYNFIKY